MSGARLAEVLEADYEKLRAALGHDGFLELAAAYVAARNCHLYTVGNLNSRQFALAFSKSESVNDFPQLCSITA